jgi:hypothetical protein
LAGLFSVTRPTTEKRWLAVMNQQCDEAFDELIFSFNESMESSSGPLLSVVGFLLSD